HVEYVAERKGGPELVKMLRQIKEGLPAAKEEVKGEEASTDEAEKQKEKLGPIQEILDELGTLQHILTDNYIKAVSVGSDIFAAEIDRANAVNEAQNLKDSRDKGLDLGQSKIRAELQKKRAQKAELQSDI